jgi:copper chaperone
MTTTFTRVYDVPDISCDHCKHAIESEVGSVPGVDVVEVDIAAKTVRVQGVGGDQAVRDAIGAAGYDITAVH